MWAFANTVAVRRLRGLGLAAAVVLGGGAAPAQPAQKPAQPSAQSPVEDAAAALAALDLKPGPCLTDAQRAQMGKDSVLVAAAEQAVLTKGYAALRPHVAGLHAVLERAPVGLKTIEACPGRYIVHGPNEKTAVLASMFLMTVDGESRGANVVIAARDPYSLAAFYLGGLKVEQGDYAAAVPILQRGLAMSPYSILLASETATALQLSGRSAESLEVATAGLAVFRGLHLDGMEKAALLRRRGYALIELHRYDAALDAYRESVKLDPQNHVAAEEIATIVQLKARAGGSAVGVVTNPEARAPGDAPPPLRDLTPLSPPEAPPQPVEAPPLEPSPPPSEARPQPQTPTPLAPPPPPSEPPPLEASPSPPEEAR
jgi:tetratricopeptide (TPR) repeat protein